MAKKTKSKVGWGGTGKSSKGGGKAAIKAAKNGIDFSKGWRKATEGGRFPGIGIKAAGGEAATAAGAGGAGGIFGKVLKGAGWVGGALLLMHLIDKLYSGTVGERDKQKAGMDEREALSHSIQAQLTDQDWQSREMATQVGAYDNQRLAASGAEMGEANLSDLIRGHEDSLRAQAQMDQPSMLDLLAVGRG